MAAMTDKEQVARVANSFLEPEIQRFNATDPSGGVTGVGAHASRQAKAGERSPSSNFRS